MVCLHRLNGKGQLAWMRAFYCSIECKALASLEVSRSGERRVPSLNYEPHIYSGVVTQLIFNNLFMLANGQLPKMHGTP